MFLTSPLSLRFTEEIDVLAIAATDSVNRMENLEEGSGGENSNPNKGYRNPIMLDNYKFTFNNFNGTHSFYRCCNHSKMKCKATLKVLFQDDQVTIVNRKDTHACSQAPTLRPIAVLTLQDEMKEMTMKIVEEDKSRRKNAKKIAHEVFNAVKEKSPGKNYKVTSFIYSLIILLCYYLQTLLQHQSLDSTKS